MVKIIDRLTCCQRFKIIGIMFGVVQKKKTERSGEHFFPQEWGVKKMTSYRFRLISSPRSSSTVVIIFEFA